MSFFGVDRLAGLGVLLAAGFVPHIFDPRVRRMQAR
jgi:hypothetical protein